MENHEGYITVDEVLEGYYEEAEESSLSKASLIREIGSLLNLIMPTELLQKDIIEVDIKNYRGELPCGIVELHQIRDKENNRVIYSSSDLFHQRDKNLGFTLNKRHIFVDFKKGTIEMSVDIIPIDKEGLPLIPKNESFVLAIQNHLLYKNARKLFVQRKITGDILQMYDQERSWYIAQAESRSKIPSLSQMERIKKSYMELVENVYKFETNFKN